MILAGIGLTSCKTEIKDNATEPISVSGYVKNISDTTILFQYEPYSLLAKTGSADIEIDSAGRFNFTIETLNPLKGFLSFGKVPKTYNFNVTMTDGKDSSMQVGSVDFRMIYLYLSPGDSLSVSLDAGRIQESLEFSGKGAANNEFVNREEWKFNDYKSKYLNNYYHITYLDPKSYKKEKLGLRDIKLQFLEDFNKGAGLNPHLKEIYGNQYNWEIIQKLISYPASHAGFNEDKYPDLPGDYYDFLDAVKIPENIDNMGIGAYYYLNSVFRKKHELAVKDNQTSLEFYDFVNHNMPGWLAYVFKAYSLDRDFRKELYDEFDESCPYPDIADLVKEKYGHLEGMLKGSPGPDFSLKDVNGNIYKLTDFKGNIVYIDFWATWCKPCIAEIPHLEKLQEEFKDKDIKFVSISIDSEKDSLKWKNFVLENNLKGIQLWADKEHHEMFSNNLNIKSIPRFTLLDQEGRIIDAQALRPSDPELAEVLAELL